MDVLQSILGDMSITKFDVQTDHWVNVTHIIDPHNFYVRPTQCSIFIMKLETSQPEIKPSSVNEYDVIIYNIDRSSSNSRYGRGRICNKYVDGDIFKYDIFAIDYGYFHKMVPQDFIWECNEDLSTLPPLALHCQLANCAVIGGGTWSKMSIDAFKSYVGNEKAKILILEKTFEKLVVELKNSNPHDISTLMALTHFSTLGYAHNAISRMPTVVPVKQLIRYKSINVNDVLHVRVQSGKSLKAFYVADVNDYRNFMKEYDDITYYTKKESKLPEEQFKVDTPVCVKNYTNKYERAIITKIISATRSIVKLVDWGKEEEVHILNMKPMPEYCMKIPVLAIYCSANERNTLYSHALHRFLCPGVEFVIQIEELGAKFDSPNIVNIIPLKS